MVAEPLEAITLEVVESPVPAIARIWGRRSVPRLQMEWNGEKVKFAIPAAIDMGAVLKDRIELLRRDSGHGVSSPVV